MRILNEMQNRRTFLKRGSMILAAAPLLHPGHTLAAEPPEGEDIPAVEELMREHGILDRLLLIYEDIALRLAEERELPEEALPQATYLIRRYVQDFHEKLEEEYVFPWFASIEGFSPLVKVLVQQHKAGRLHVERLNRLGDREALGNPRNRSDVAKSLKAFITMYRPHKSREDTVLFPALHERATAYDLASLSEIFMEREEKTFGTWIFREMVEEVGMVEKELNIYRLELFTPEI
ncbi:hemerythrin domain-containing protein [Geobacter sp. DSM 9736]|uniref:hemerythrin domain-containing protein n=1 Tax=Geobacter sp. DSM 9736 TaxID=1277350 RepID=UPI000B50A247|nr:hemerythrin domain-containing protein [Geobacter sp. DSM 9736]SNB47778.1 Hemerythrin-like domain-containing protein [Geobacter sp. DSM 9736]